MFGFLGFERTLPGHVELLVNQHPKVLLLRAALIPFIPQPVLILGVSPTQAQDPALCLLSLMRLAQAHLSSLSRCLWMASLPSSMSTQHPLLSNNQPKADFHLHPPSPI